MKQWRRRISDYLLRRRLLKAGWSTWVAELWNGDKETGTRKEVDKFAVVYFCPQCNKQLTEGPSGGAAINLLCQPCNVNYGCREGGEWGLGETVQPLSERERRLLIGEDVLFEQELRKLHNGLIT